MKKIVFVFTMIMILLMNWTVVNAQNFTCTVQNQTVVSNQFKFDIYVQTTSGSFYIGNCDFVVTFNSANFTSPTVSRSINGAFLAGAGDGYVYSMSASIVSSNRIILNVNAPAWDDQTMFDAYVVQPSGIAPGTRVATITVTGITTPSGTANIQWRTAAPNNTGISNTGNTTPWTMTNITVNGTFTNPADKPLPVELTSFTASVNQLSAELKWSTATEVNNYGFEIEKRAVSDKQSAASSWVKIGFVKGNGTSNTKQSYSFSENVTESGSYAYRLKQIDNDGAFKYSQEAEVTIEVPKVFTLNQNYPNPFNPTTTISFTLAQDGITVLRIFDMLGREVATLANGAMKAGVVQHVTFDASRLSSGIYFSCLENNGQRQIKKITLMK